LSYSSKNRARVIDGASDTVITTIPVGDGPWGVGVNPNTNKIYVAIFNYDTVSVIADHPLHVIPEPATIIGTFLMFSALAAFYLNRRRQPRFM
jgi:YVTN family beta-propeller protein